MKFRIWDKEHDRWLANDSGTHCSSDWHIRAFTGAVVNVIRCDNGEVSTSQRDYYFKDEWMIRQSPYVPQMFTGLQDINGVDIYDGDIVRWGNSSTFAVKYTPPSFNIWYDYETCEVIGNIFENPELLKE